MARFYFIEAHWNDSLEFNRQLLSEEIVQESVLVGDAHPTHGNDPLEFNRQLLSEEIVQESVIYQDILQKGEQKGEQKEAFRFLNRQLNRKFGSIDPSIVNRILALSTEELETLGEEFLGFSDVADLLAWLDLSTRT